MSRGAALRQPTGVQGSSDMRPSGCPWAQRQLWAVYRAVPDINAHDVCRSPAKNSPALWRGVGGSPEEDTRRVERGAGGISPPPSVSTGSRFFDGRSDEEASVGSDIKQEVQDPQNFDLSFDGGDKLMDNESDGGAGSTSCTDDEVLLLGRVCSHHSFHDKFMCWQEPLSDEVLLLGRVCSHHSFHVLAGATKHQSQVEGRAAEI